MDQSVGSEGYLAFNCLGNGQFETFVEVLEFKLLMASCCQVSLQKTRVFWSDFLFFFSRYFRPPNEQQVSCDIHTSAQVDTYLHLKRLGFEGSINMHPRIRAETCNEIFKNWTSSQGIEEHVKSVLLESFFVLLLPLSFSDNDMCSSLFFQNISLLLSSDDVQQRNAQSLASLVEHSS